MKGERNRKASRSRVSITCGIVFGVLVAFHLFAMGIGIKLGNDYTSQQLTARLLPVLLPAGILAYGLIEGLGANWEIRRSSAESERPPGVSLVFAAILLIVLLLLVLLVIKTQSYCTANPLHCEIF